MGGRVKGRKFWVLEPRALPSLDLARDAAGTSEQSLRWIPQAGGGKMCSWGCTKGNFRGMKRGVQEEGCQGLEESGPQASYLWAPGFRDSWSRVWSKVVSTGPRASLSLKEPHSTLTHMRPRSSSNTATCRASSM